VPSVRRGTIPQDATLTSGSGDAGAMRLVGGAMGSGADLKRVSRLEMALPRNRDWLAGEASHVASAGAIGGGLHIAALVLRLTTRFHARRAGDGSRAETVAGGETATRQSTHTQPSDRLIRNVR
jgi:hypothetical protein